MEIQACSLGCSSAFIGGQFSCGITDIAVNQEIRVIFSSPIDLGSVNNDTFQVVETLTGVTPPASFRLDPSDPRVVIYRPNLSFDSGGNPVFGLTEDGSYRIRIPGSQDDPGPYIRSQDGRANATRLSCFVLASQGIFDSKPGRPRLDTRVTVIDPQTNQPVPGQRAEGARDVAGNSPVVLNFDDLMNPSTLVDISSSTSESLRVTIDPDGNLGTVRDRVEIRGRWSLFLNQDALTTQVVFTPDAQYPSRGQDDANPRRIVLEVSSTIVDLGGNPLINPGVVAFTTQQFEFPFASIVEEFEDSAREDARRSGAPWGEDGGLAPGRGGGSGRLGDLSVPSGVAVILSTDSENFAGISNADIFDPAAVIGSEFDPDTGGILDPVVDGVFEFSRLSLGSGSALILRGSRPGRLLVRGSASIDGVIDVAGDSAPVHDAESLVGGSGAQPGPGGGRGGDGGARPDGTAFVDLGGVPNPGIVLYGDVDGKAGEGIPFPDALSPLTRVGAGAGSIAWPQPTAVYPDLRFPNNPEDLEPLQFSDFASPRCKIVIPSGGAGGGANAVSGFDSTTVFFPLGHPTLPDQFNIPPEALGGDREDLAITELVKSLSPELGLLRGGGGGGGAGAHIEGTRTDGFFGGCTLTLQGTEAVMVEYRHSSGAAGGGAGGGLQVQAGRELRLNGTIDLRGGDGGSTGEIFTTTSSAGGAGAGGSLLLQSPSILIDDIPRRIDFRGGTGGVGYRGSLGGDGGAGFLRIEALDPIPRVEDVVPFLRPQPEELALFGAEVDEVFTVGTWGSVFSGPAARSGAQSCWIQPPGNFFLLRYQEDDGADLGWDLTLRVLGDPDPQSFRGPNDLFSMPLEDVLGNELGSSPLTVLFQGARLVDLNADLCDVRLQGDEAQIQVDSLTPWVRHPAELNTAEIGNSSNMFRFLVIWDAGQPGFGQLLGVDSIQIDVQPD